MLNQTHSVFCSSPQCNMIVQLFVICLGPICIPIWGLLPILFTLFPSLRKYIVGERSPTWLRKCLCVKKDSNPPRIKVTEERAAELNHCLDTYDGTQPIPVQTPADYYHLFNQLLYGKNKKNIIVQWTATWCQPCKDMEPVVHKLALSTKDRCIFLKCDLDLLSSLSRECEIAAGNEKCFPNFFLNFLSFLRVYSCMNSHLLLNPPVMRLAYLIVAVVFFLFFFFSGSQYQPLLDSLPQRKTSRTNLKMHRRRFTYVEKKKRNYF